MEEKRSFVRAPFDSVASLILGNQIWKMQLLNISLQGALLQTEESLPLFSTEETLILRIERDGIALELKVLLSLQEGKEIRVKFHDMELDSLTYLRQLIASITGDFEEVCDELENLSGTEE